MGYISVEKLKRLIESEYKKYVDMSKHTNAALQYQYIADGLDIAEQLVDSIQQEQPELDLELEKEIDSYYGIIRKDGKTYNIEDGEECADWKEMFNPYAEIAFARHFYERGRLNARKEN